MFINNNSNKSKSLYHHTLFLLGIDRNDTITYPIEDFIRSANSWYKKVNTWIWQVVGTWEFDDTNYTDFPILSTDLNKGQRDYELPADIQKIEKVNVLWNNELKELKPVDKSMVNVPLETLYKDNGEPICYDITGKSILLYPASNQDIPEGLQVILSRGIKEFQATDTTREPGFVEDYHEALSVGAALDFAIVTNSNKVNFLREKIQLLEDDIKRFYGSTQRNFRPKIIIKRKNYK